MVAVPAHILFVHPARARDLLELLLLLVLLLARLPPSQCILSPRV